VIDNQLAASAKKIGERFFALRPVKRILLFDFFPWHFPPLLAQFIAQPRKLLLLLQQFLARRQPFRWRHNLRLASLRPSHDSSPLIPRI